MKCKNRITNICNSGFTWLFFSFLVASGLACTNTNKPAQSIRIELFLNAGAIAQKASDILAREITERSGAKVVEDKADLTIQLKVQPGIGTEGFKIEGRKGSIVITGNDENGLLYGVGKFLHTSRYDQGGLTASTWRGTSVPKGTMRGMYFATHFNNFYEAASEEELKTYIESLALWGVNSLVVHFPNPWLEGYDDPKTKFWISKARMIMTVAKSVGIRTGLLPVVNAGFSTTPKEIMATRGVWTQTMGPVIICPSKPEGRKRLVQDWTWLLDQFSDIGIDQVCYWPYDEGGCACKDCMPWGAVGYPKLCEAYSQVVRAKYPKAKIILSTWFYDTDLKLRNGDIGFYTDGEFAGLAKYLEKDKSWVDYLMVDAPKDFPKYPLKVGVPGNLPMVNFPEISMWGHGPWGGYGANPMPDRFQKLWDETQHKMIGGFPYSEGIYEDINKIITTQFYWDPEKPAKESLKEYIGYEYAPSVADSVVKAIDILEQNITRDVVVRKSQAPKNDSYYFDVFLQGSRVGFLNPDKSKITPERSVKLKQTAEEAYRLLDRVDRQLPERARKSWRWRILYLRSVIDRELVHTDGWLEGPVLKDAFAELTRIYHCENASRSVHVPRIDDPNIRFSEQAGTK